MTKIYLNENSIENYINGNIANAMTHLENAKNMTKWLNMPYDFGYRNYMKQLADCLYEDLNTLSTVYNKIKTHCSNYSYVNNDMYNDLLGLENYSISIRYSSIK